MIFIIIIQIWWKFCSHPNSNEVITTKFCTWHGSCAVMACANICCDQMAMNGFTTKQMWCQIWICGWKISSEMGPWSWVWFVGMHRKLKLDLWINFQIEPEMACISLSHRISFCIRFESQSWYIKPFVPFVELVVFGIGQYCVCRCCDKCQGICTHNVNKPQSLCRFFSYSYRFTFYIYSDCF